MCQTDFPGLWILSATHQCDLRYRVVRSAEGSLTDQTRVAIQFASHRMYLGGLQTLGQRQRG